MLHKLEFYISYISEGTLKEKKFTSSFENEDLSLNIEKSKENTLSKLTVCINPKKTLELKEIYGDLAFEFQNKDKVFANGYQSWTDSREFSLNERIKGISPFALPIAKKFKLESYGDYKFHKYSRKKGDFHSYTYSYIRRENIYHLFASLTEKSGFTVIETSASKRKVKISKDSPGHIINDKYTPFEIIYIKGSEEKVFNEYFQSSGIEKPRIEKVVGWTSWYNYYENITEEKILKNLDNFGKEKKKIDIFQIDDGYQEAVGDWLKVDREKFPNGMKYIAEKIHSKGFKAGIWLSPFICEKNSSIYENHKDWLVKNEKGKPLCAGSNWSNFYSLDIYNKEVQDYLNEVFTTILQDWKYDMVKLDFLYAACIIPRKDKTRGEIMTYGVDLLRDMVRDKLILGCGVPLGPAFGKFDYCRIGCDVGLDWDDKFYMKFLHRERISTLNSLTNTISRRHLNGRAFINDPDVFLLRDESINLSKVQKKTLAVVNSIFGGLLFTSDDISNYNERHKRMLNQIINSKNIIINKLEIPSDNIYKVNYLDNSKKKIAYINLNSKPYKIDNLYLKPYESKILQEV